MQYERLLTAGLAERCTQAPSLGLGRSSASTYTDLASASTVRRCGLLETLQDVVQQGAFHEAAALLSQHKIEAQQLFAEPLGTAREEAFQLLAAAAEVKGALVADRSALHELLRRFAGKGLAQLDMIGNDGRTALHVAIRSNNIAAITALLDLGADPGIREVSKDEVGDIALHLLARFIKNCPPKPLLRLCGKNFELLNIAGVRGDTALHVALQSNNPIPAALLVDRGADVHLTNDDGNLPVHLVHCCIEPSIMRECMPMLRKLCGKGNALLNAPGAAGLTPLHAALCNNRITAAIALLEIGASTSSRDAKGDMAIHIAAAHVKPCTVALMRRLAGRSLVLLNAPGAEGSTPLHAALRANSHVAAGALLELGADTSVRDVHEDLALHLAASHVKPCHLPLLQCLAGKGLNARGHMGRTALQAALHANNATAATALVDFGADVTIRDQEGDLAIHIGASALKPCTMALFRLLSGRGLGLLNLRGASECTPLHAALRANNPPAASILLDLGADETMRDGQGNMPLHLAASFLQPCTTALLHRLSGRQFSMLNAHGAEDRTALNTALRSQNPAAAAALLELNAQALSRSSKPILDKALRSQGVLRHTMYRHIGASLVNSTPRKLGVAC